MTAAFTLAAHGNLAARSATPRTRRRPRRAAAPPRRWRASASGRYPASWWRSLPVIGPLLTEKVHAILRAAARAGTPAVECSLDLDRSRTTVEVGVAEWTCQGQRFPYLATC